MANVFESQKRESIFKDERFLYPDFVPERLPFRDKEISDLVFSLKPAAMGKKPENIFITGKPGTGKTVTSKFVLNELTEYSDRVKCIYINCFELNTRNSILAKATNFFGYPVPLRGVSSEEIFERFVSVIRSKNIIPIFVFDESEQLLKQDDTKKMLYDLSRLGEQFKIFCAMLFISNDSFFLSQLDDRVRSSLQASTVDFDPYLPSQLKEILKQRAEYAFYPQTLESEVIPLAAAHAAKNNGDARIAIDVLLKAARIAERSNSKKVLLEHVRKAFMEEKVVKVEITSNFSTQEKGILSLLDRKPLTSGEIYLALKEKFAERTLRQALSDLEGKNVVVSQKVQKGKGFTRIFTKKTK